MLNVTKYRIQIYGYKHVNHRHAPLMRSLTAKWFFEMAGIPSAAFLFDEDLATELETYTKANVKLLLREVNVVLASSNTLACYTGRSSTQTSRSTCASWLHLDGVSIPKSVTLIFLAAISQENFPSNVHNHTMHTISRA